VALSGKFPIAPGTRPDPRFETLYVPELGGHYPPSQIPAKPEEPKDEEKKAS
jgi:hypothetical protein